MSSHPANLDSSVRNKGLISAFNSNGVLICSLLEVSSNSKNWRKEMRRGSVCRKLSWIFSHCQSFWSFFALLLLWRFPLDEVLKVSIFQTMILSKMGWAKTGVSVPFLSQGWRPMNGGKKFLCGMSRHRLVLGKKDVVLKRFDNWVLRLFLARHTWGDFRYQGS